MLEDLLSKGSMLKNFDPKFKIFKGLFDLEDQDQGYLFLSSSETFTRPIHISSLTVKFKTIHKLSHSQGITQMTTSTGPKTIMSPPCRGSGGDINPCHSLHNVFLT